MSREPIRTLLVEDNPGDALLIRERLRRERPSRFQVEHVTTLDSALSRLEEGRVDVVLLDLGLPDSRGVETVARVHRAAPEVAIVVLTGIDDEDLALRSVQAKAEDYLVKGAADEVAIARAIRHAHERHRLQVELEGYADTLERSEAKFRTLIANSADGMVVASQAGKVLFANPAAATLFGRPAEALQGTTFPFPLSEDGRFEVDLSPEPDGGVRVVEMRVVGTEWEGAPARLASLRDITGHKLAEERLTAMTAELLSLNQRLEHLANVDPLTSLLNRRGLESVLSIEVQRARRSGTPLQAVLVDLDDFKRVNETLGHAVGDVVLKEVAGRMAETLRPTDHLARIGGDEFLFLLPETRLAEAAGVAERVRMAVAENPLRLPSGPMRVTASLGVESVPAGVVSIEEILARTQLALAHSKRSGKNRVSGAVEEGEPCRESSRELRQALRRGNPFRIVRQALVRLEDETVAGWELLARGEPGPFEMPSDFFRAALEENLLTLVDLECLKAALLAARELGPGERCHVNLFPSTLLDTPHERLIELFSRDGPRFCVEISEQQFIGEPGILREAVTALKAAGIEVAIDDVGFGRSSLETLILLEPDVVKIDRKLVHGVAGDPGVERTLRSLIGVARAIGSGLVAEGIETREDLELVRSAGVAYGQGFLWGEPG